MARHYPECDKRAGLGQPRRTEDTERGTELQTRIKLLERLIEAYQNNELHQTPMDSKWRSDTLP